MKRHFLHSAQRIASRFAAPVPPGIDPLTIVSIIVAVCQILYRCSRKSDADLQASLRERYQAGKYDQRLLADVAIRCRQQAQRRGYALDRTEANRLAIEILEEGRLLPAENFSACRIEANGGLVTGDLPEWDGLTDRSAEKELPPSTISQET